ncbi:MAG: hypothetical protein NVS3B20_05440 [Polyangiales bacterium]
MTTSRNSVHELPSETKSVPGAVGESKSVHRYSDVRGDIRDADLLLFHGRSLLSKICIIGGGGGYSHAALVFWEADRVRLVQATGTGVHVDFLSDELLDYDGAVELWRLKKEFYADFLAAPAVAEARRHVGAPYALKLCLWFVVDWLLHPILHRNFRSHTRSARAFFCSELVARAYRVGGKVKLCPRHADAGTGPGDIVKGGRVECIHAFARTDVVSRVENKAAEAAAKVPPNDRHS